MPALSEKKKKLIKKIQEMDDLQLSSLEPFFSLIQKQKEASSKIMLLAGSWNTLPESSKRKLNTSLTKRRTSKRRFSL